MLSTRVIDGLTVHRAGGPFRREIHLQGGTQSERDQVLRDLEAVLDGQPHTRTFRLALGRLELMTRRGGISIGLSREDETVLRGKLESATDASLADVRSTAQKVWR
ncbi:MAG: hypothetical protein ACAI38_04970 [Myxococcota bacterium]